MFSFLPVVQFQLKAFDISVSELSVELNYGQWIKELQAEAGYPQVGKRVKRKKSSPWLNCAQPRPHSFFEKLNNRLDDGDHNSWSATGSLLVEVVNIIGVNWFSLIRRNVSKYSRWPLYKVLVWLIQSEGYFNLHVGPENLHKSRSNIFLVFTFLPH